MMLTNADVVDLTEFRHLLHRHPEVSRPEEWTAAQVVQALERLRPNRIVTGLGCHGVAAIWDAPEAGPTVMFRSELDGLPIEGAGETGPALHNPDCDFPDDLIPQGVAIFDRIRRDLLG